MGERIIEQEIKIKDRVREYFCDNCGDIIYTYKDSDILEGKRFDKPYECREIIRVAQDEYRFSRMLCRECSIKKTKEVRERLEPILIDLGFVKDRG